MEPLVDEARDAKPATLRKSLGLFQLAIYGIGTIIGAGIYAVITPAAAAAGDAVWISFVLAALISAFSALSYAELASALPGAAGEHHFLSVTFPSVPALAFAVGLFISIHSAATFATVALTFGNYLGSLTGWPAIATALGLMGLMTAVNIGGVTGASRLNAVLTIVQVLCLLAFAATALSGGDALARLTPKLDLPTDWVGVLQGTAVIFFIYTGYEHMAVLSEEAHRPDRDMWRAFIIALAVTTVVYLLIVFAVLAVADTAQIAQSNAPLAFAALQVSGTLGNVILGAALLATANAVLSAALSGSRMLFGMARAGDLPPALASMLGPQGSPWVAALVFLAAAAIFVTFGRIEWVASLSSLGALLVFVAINVAVIVLRYRRPDLPRPFRIPSIGKVPVTAVLGIVTSLAIAVQFDAVVYGAFLVATIVGIAAYVAVRRRGPRPQDDAS